MEAAEYAMPVSLRKGILFSTGNGGRGSDCFVAGFTTYSVDPSRDSKSTAKPSPQQAEIWLLHL